MTKTFYIKVEVSGDDLISSTCIEKILHKCKIEIFKNYIRHFYHPSLSIESGNDKTSTLLAHAVYNDILTPDDTSDIIDYASKRAIEVKIAKIF